jgi:hypothetical protein
VSLTKVGNQAKTLKYSEEKLFSYQFSAMFKHTATILDTHPTTQQRMTYDSKMPGCCCLDTGNKILFRVTISLPFTTIVGLDRVGLWLGLPGYQTSHQ